MKARQRFDTPFKRICLLTLIAGTITLTVSLIVWTQQSRYDKIYYSKNHYQWLPVDDEFSGSVERSWSWDHDCVKPLAQARIVKLKKELEDHRRTRPEEPSTKSSPGDMLRWFSKEISLQTSVRSEIGFIYRDLRESEVLRPGPYDLFQEPPRQETTRHTDEEFRDKLYSKLGLMKFPTSERDAIFEKCVQETLVGYKYIRTSHHTELDDWPDDHPLPFWLGLFLILAGFMGSYGYRMSSFMGSYGYRMSSLAIRGTVGRLVSWVKTGSGYAQSKGVSIREEDPAPTDTVLSATVIDSTHSEQADNTSER